MVNDLLTILVHAVDQVLQVSGTNVAIGVVSEGAIDELVAGVRGQAQVTAPLVHHEIVVNASVDGSGVSGSEAHVGANHIAQIGLLQGLAIGQSHGALSVNGADGAAGTLLDSDGLIEGGQLAVGSSAIGLQDSAVHDPRGHVGAQSAHGVGSQVADQDLHAPTASRGAAVLAVGENDTLSGVSGVGVPNLGHLGIQRDDNIQLAVGAVGDEGPQVNVVALHIGLGSLRTVSISSAVQGAHAVVLIAAEDGVDVVDVEALALGHGVNTGAGSAQIVSALSVHDGGLGGLVEPSVGVELASAAAVGVGVKPNLVGVAELAQGSGVVKVANHAAHVAGHTASDVGGHSGNAVIAVALVGDVLIGVGPAIGISSNAQLGGGLAGGLVAHDNTVIPSQAEVGPAQGAGGVVQASGHVAGLIAESGGVHHGGGDSGLEQNLGHSIAAGGGVQVAGAVVGGVHVDQQAGGVGGLTHADLPATAGELVVGVIAHGAQHHGQDLVTSHLIGGVERSALSVGALDDLGVPQVADVARVPLVGGHVIEGSNVGPQSGAVFTLCILHVAGGETVDNGRRLGAGDVGAGTEVAIVVTLKDFHAGDNADALVEDGSDVFAVIEGSPGAVPTGGVRGGDHGEGHHHRQNQREKLLQISHRIVSSF